MIPRNKILKKKTNTKKVPIDYKKIELAKQITKGNQPVLSLGNITEEELPCVSVLTITRNRNHLFPLCIDNWKRFKYPAYKLEWIIVDDSDEKEYEILSDTINKLNDGRINLFHMFEVKTIGFKRNFGIESSKFDYIFNMDDDDFHHSDEILGKVRVMLKYAKQCLISLSSGMYYLHDNTSLMTVNYISEGMMMFTKKFWEKEKFEDTNISEGYKLIKGREKEIIDLPGLFNGILINHSKNISRGEGMTFGTTSLQRMFSGNFYNLSFDESFKKIIDELRGNK